MRVPLSTSSNSAEATKGTRGMRLRSCSIFVAFRHYGQAWTSLQPDAELLRSPCGGAFVRKVNFLTQPLLLATKLRSSVLCQLLNAGMSARSRPPRGVSRRAQVRLLEIFLRHTLIAVLSTVAHTRYSAKSRSWTGGKAGQYARKQQRRTGHPSRATKRQPSNSTTATQKAWQEMARASPAFVTTRNGRAGWRLGRQNQGPGRHGVQRSGNQPVLQPQPRKGSAGTQGFAAFFPFHEDACAGGAERFHRVALKIAESHPRARSSGDRRLPNRLFRPAASPLADYFS